MHNRPVIIKSEPALRRARAGVALVALCLAVLLWPAAGRAQEALRTSLAEQQAQRARQSTADIPYNIKIGDAKLRFSAGLGMDYNDNINVVESGAVGDLVIRPDVTTDLIWPITEQNTILFSVSVGYNKYIDNDDSDSLLIRPGSLLSFDVFVDNFRINLHDRFSFFQDPLQQGAVSGTNRVNSRYGTGENVIGVGVDWDLNKVVLSAGYDHMNSFATSSDFDYLNRSSEFFFLRASVLTAPELTLGAEATAGITTYNSQTQTNGQSQLNNSDQYSIGPFIDWQLSEFMRLGLRVGYQTYSFDTTTNAADTSSYYATLTLDHDISRYVRYTLGGGHLVSLGVNSDAVNLTFIRMTARWQILRQTDLTTDIFFEHGEETGSLTAETFDRFGFSFGLGYLVTQKLTVGLRYSFTDKESDQPSRGYVQNVIGMNLGYRF